MSKNLFLENQEEQPENTGLAVELNSLLTSDKATLTEKISDALQMVNDGLVDPLDALIYAKKGEFIFKELIAGLKGKADIQGSKFSRHSADIIEKMVGVAYDYANCGDPEYNELIAKIAPLLEQKKKIEERLKKQDKKIVQVDEETGETFEVYPPKKTGTLSLQLTLK